MGKATNSMNSCSWIEEGIVDNYLVHPIQDVIKYNSDIDFTIEWMDSEGTNGQMTM